MAPLWQYFEELEWARFNNDLVNRIFDSNSNIYKQISGLNAFDADVSKAFAALAPHMFGNDFNEFLEWIDVPTPALDNKSILETAADENGMDTLREFIMRYP